MKNLFLPLILLLALTSAAQVEVDHSIQLTGSGANARIRGVHAVMDSADAASAATIQNGSLIYAVATGTSNNFTITINPPVAAYRAGMVFNFISNQNVTGAATLNVNNLGAVAITKNINQSMGQCDIQNGQAISVLFDGTNFQMLSVSVAATPTTANAGPNQFDTGVTTTTLAANTPVSGTGLWIIVSGSGGSIANTGSPTSTFSGVAGNTYVLEWTVSSCGASSSSYDTITFVVTAKSIAGLYIWYDGADSSTLSLSGSSVTQWNDKSGNNHNCSQSNSSYQPTLVGNTLNGHSVLNFNGTSEYLNTSPLQLFSTDTSPRTVIVVFTDNDNTTQRFVLTQPPASYPPYCTSETEIGVDAGSLGTGNYGVHAGCGNATVSPANTVANSTWNIMTILIKSTGSSPNQLSIYQNGGSPLTVSNGGSSGYWSAGNYPTQSQPLYVGGRAYLNDGYLSGYMAEVLVYNRQLSSAELNELHSYLSSKYGIAVSNIP